MAQQRETYKGFEIVIEKPTTPTPATGATAAGTPFAGKLIVGPREIDVVEAAPGIFITSYLPHTSYTSVSDLAKAVIDHTEEYNTTLRG
ncbi:MAG: hypothetical protein DPW09_33510 [Anaerolineae bacterium]|nr:hypothetical protein [Anaerolineae bacterium]